VQHAFKTISRREKSSGGGHGKGIEVILPLWHAVFKKIFLL
jgi:hypothetical protein